MKSKEVGTVMSIARNLPKQLLVFIKFWPSRALTKGSDLSGPLLRTLVELHSPRMSLSPLNTSPQASLVSRWAQGTI